MKNAAPTVRAHVFIDGQNLTFAARSAFGYPMANFDIRPLVEEVCRQKGWEPASVTFYTGMPCRKINPRLHWYWTHKLTDMRSKGVATVALPLKYVTTAIRKPDGSPGIHHQAHEKGVDVRIAVDIISASHDPDCGAILIFSQDNDLREALLGAQKVAVRAQRRIEMACAFPASEHTSNAHGIRGIEALPISRAMYDRCIDTNNYFSEPKPAPRKVLIDRAEKAQAAIEAHARTPAPALA